jgi:hypothetical protein
LLKTPFRATLTIKLAAGSKTLTVAKTLALAQPHLADGLVELVVLLLADVLGLAQPDRLL